MRDHCQCDATLMVVVQLYPEPGPGLPGGMYTIMKWIVESVKSSAS